MQRASARGRVNCAGNGGCASAAGALLMEEEILRLNNCLSLQLGDGHEPKRSQVFGSPLLCGIIILDSRDKMIETLSQIISTS